MRAIYIPPELRIAAEQDQGPGSTEEKVRRYIREFLEENLTEERSDVALEKIKELVTPKVPLLLRPVVSLAFGIIDRFMPEALIRGIDAALAAVASRF